VNYKELVISPHYGKIAEIYIEKGSRINEGEQLFSIQTLDGNMEYVSMGAYGYIHSLEVCEGEDVIPGMVLAFVQTEF
jgi:biotin carboxyl carrier protein